MYVVLLTKLRMLRPYRFAIITLGFTSGRINGKIKILSAGHEKAVLSACSLRTRARALIRNCRSGQSLLDHFARVGYRRDEDADCACFAPLAMSAPSPISPHSSTFPPLPLVPLRPSSHLQALGIEARGRTNISSHCLLHVQAKETYNFIRAITLAQSS